MMFGKEFPKKIKITLTDDKVRDITKEDQKILKTHDFEKINIKKASLFNYRLLNYMYIFRCKICSAEAGIINSDDYGCLIYVFYYENNNVKFDTCSALIMQRACK